MIEFLSVIALIFILWTISHKKKTMTKTPSDSDKEIANPNNAEIELLSRRIDRLVLHIKKYPLQDGARSVLVNMVVKRKYLRENKDPTKVKEISEELKSEKQRKKDYWEIPAFLRNIKN